MTTDEVALRHKIENILGEFEAAMRGHASQFVDYAHEGAFPEGWHIDHLLFGTRQWGALYPFMNDA